MVPRQTSALTGRAGPTFKQHWGCQRRHDFFSMDFRRVQNWPQPCSSRGFVRPLSGAMVDAYNRPQRGRWRGQSKATIEV